MIQIRQATIQDLETLKAVAQQTFAETFSNSNSKEDMQKYIDEHFTNQQLTQELKAKGSFFYLAFDDAQQCVGYLKLNTGEAQSEDEDPNALEIERIYVCQSFHGRGVGQMLFNFAYDLFSTQRYSYLWLGVWEHNKRAIRFYERNGFRVYGEHVFVLGNDAQRDLLMRLDSKRLSE